MNRIKTETGTSILIPSNNEHSNILRIEGSPKGVALAKEEILQMVKKLVSEMGVWLRAVSTCRYPLHGQVLEKPVENEEVYFLKRCSFGIKGIAPT